MKTFKVLILFAMILGSLSSFSNDNELLARLYRDQGYFKLYNCDVEILVNESPAQCWGQSGCRVRALIYAKDWLRGNEIEFSHIFNGEDLKEIPQIKEKINQFNLNHLWNVGELRSYQYFETNYGLNDDLVAIEISEGVIPVKPIKRRVRCSANPY